MQFQERYEGHTSGLDKLLGMTGFKVIVFLGIQRKTLKARKKKMFKSELRDYMPCDVDITSLNNTSAATPEFGMTEYLDLEICEVFHPCHDVRQLAGRKAMYQPGCGRRLVVIVNSKANMKG